MLFVRNVILLFRLVFTTIQAVSQEPDGFSVGKTLLNDRINLLDVK